MYAKNKNYVLVLGFKFWQVLVASSMYTYHLWNIGSSQQSRWQNDKITEVKTIILQEWKGKTEPNSCCSLFPIVASFNVCVDVCYTVLYTIHDHPELELIPVCNNGRIPSPVDYWPWNVEWPWLAKWPWVVPRAPHHPETVFILHMPVKFYVFFVYQHQ